MTDIVFTATKDANRERVDGVLRFPKQGKSFAARSGSRTLLPLPNGYYHCTIPRVRSSAKMATPGATQDAAGNRRKSERANNRMSISWSVNINPQFSSGRTLLRIHPDGNSSGTQGCIGVLSNVGECFELIQKLFEQKKTLTLLVNHDNNNSNINNPQA